MNTLSVCMIVRDEAHQVGLALADCLSFADEIIVVDTGSTDDTKKVVKKIAPKVRLYNYLWRDDFSAARNISLAQATCDYILIIDADDRITQNNQQKIMELKAQMDGKKVFLFKIRNSGPDGVGVSMFQIRCFPNRPDLRYRGRAHNEIGTTIRAVGLEEIQTNIAIDHTGYARDSTLKKKHERTYGILKKEIKESPDDERTNLYLGLHFERLGLYEDAIKCLTKGIATLEPIKESKPFGLYQAYHAMIRIYHALQDQPKVAEYWKSLSVLVGAHPKLGLELTAIAEDLGLYDNYLVIP